MEYNTGIRLDAIIERLDRVEYLIGQLLEREKNSSKDVTESTNDIGIHLPKEL